MSYIETDTIEGALAMMLDDVEIPLKNIEFTIEQYLLANGARLDTQTRILLAGMRDCVGRVAGSTRELSQQCAQPAVSMTQPVLAHAV